MGSDLVPRFLGKRQNLTPHPIGQKVLISVASGLMIRRE
jgi:hypothetical protein